MTVYWALDTPLLVLLLVYFLYEYLWPSGRLPSQGQKWGIGTRCGIWSELVMKTPKRHEWPHFGVCCLLWRCFALPCALSIFGFGNVGICGALL